MKNFYIQSYYQYPVTFSSIGKTIPARSAQGEMKNLAEVTENELAKLRAREPFFRELEDKKKIRVLNHMPASYIPPAQRINEATAVADKLKAENEALKARLAALEGKKDADQDDGLEGDRGRDAVAGVDNAPAAEEGTISDGATTDDVESTDPVPAEGTKKTSSSKKGKK